MKLEVVFRIFWCKNTKRLYHKMDCLAILITAFSSGKKKKIVLGKICVQGYTYSTSYIRGLPPKRYLRCCQFKKMGCKARAVQKLNSNDVTTFSQHNHPPDINEKLECEFLNELKKLCQSGIDLRLKDIYEQVAECFPQGAKLKPFEVIRSSMTRWKSKAAELENKRKS